MNFAWLGSRRGHRRTQVKCQLTLPVECASRKFCWLSSSLEGTNYCFFFLRAKLFKNVFYYFVIVGGQIATTTTTWKPRVASEARESVVTFWLHTLWTHCGCGWSGRVGVSINWPTVYTDVALCAAPPPPLSRERSSHVVIIHIFIWRR